MQDVRSFRLNIWDVGGQKMLRSYWRNYYEQTDAMLWVVDSADAARMQVGQLPAVEGLLSMQECALSVTALSLRTGLLAGTLLVLHIAV